MSNKFQEVTQDIQARINEVAYLMWESAGRQQGMAMEYWLKAESEVMSTLHAAASRMMPSPRRDDEKPAAPAKPVAPAKPAVQVEPTATPKPAIEAPKEAKPAEAATKPAAEAKPVASVAPPSPARKPAARGKSKS